MVQSQVHERHNHLRAALIIFLCSAFQAGASDPVYRVPDQEFYANHQQFGRARIHSAHADFNSPAVILDVIVDRQGMVEYTRALEGPRGAFREAQAAERSLRFKPFFEHGKSVRARFKDTVSVYPLERWSQPRVPFPPIHDWNTMSVTLEKREFCDTPRCIAYSLELRGNGEALFNRTKWASSQPEHIRARVSQENLKEFVEECRRADFFSLMERYTVPGMTDGMGSTISVSFDDQHKEVHQYYGLLAGAPEVLSHLEGLLEQVAVSNGWLTAEAK